MSATMALTPMLAKEARALALPWFTCLTLMLVSMVGGGTLTNSLGFLAYFAGTAFLCAMAVGHEFSYGTLAALLSQPASRLRLLMIKAAVLVILLVSIYLVGQVSLFSWPTGLGAALQRELGVVVTWFPVVWALCLAPWLTMVTRSALAGAVFTVSLPGCLLFAGITLGRLLSGNENDAALVQAQFFWSAAIGWAIAGLVMGPRSFMRLEVVEGDRAMHWLAWPDRFAESVHPRTTHPIANLVKKELRLQQIAFVAAAGGVVGGVMLVATSAIPAEEPEAARNGLAFLYAWTMAMLIGAVASAEERRLQVIEWQRTLPMGSVAQWAIKSATAIGLALVLSLGPPALIMAVTSWLGESSPLDVLRLASIPTVIALTMAGLYISSLSSTGVHAFIVTFVFVTVAGLLLQVVVVPLDTWAFEMAVRIGSVTVPHGYTPPLMRVVPSVVVVCAVLWWFGGRNHASAAIAPIEVVKQVIVIGVTATAAVMLSAMVVALMQ